MTEGRIVRLNLLSRFIFVTTQEQLVDLLCHYKTNPRSLKGLVAIVDARLTILEDIVDNTKLSIQFLELVRQSRTLGLNILLVSHSSDNLDKRLENHIGYTAKIVSKEIKPRETRL